MSSFKVNNPGCCGCIFCRKTEISDDECKLIVNRQRVTQIIWEIVSISDPWERWISPPTETGTYLSIPGTSALVGQYVVNLLTPNGSTFSPDGCNAQWFQLNFIESNATFYHPDFTDDVPGSIGIRFQSTGGGFATFSSLESNVFTTNLIQSTAIDICNQIPETTYQLSGPLDRGSTTVWKMSHGFD